MLIIAAQPGSLGTLPRNGPLQGATLQRVAFWLPVAATLYSAVIALGVAHGFPGSYGLVVLCEVTLLALALATVLASGLSEEDWPALLLLYFLVVTAVILSMVNSRPMIETLRATFLLGVFALVGQRLELKTLDRMFFVISVTVLVVLLIEIFAQQTYIWLLQPQAFFSATRGIQASEYNTSGLFNTASSFEGRFSFGVFDIPRASSVFLEQVSNANFACVLALYLSTRWSDLSAIRRGVLTGTVALILISTNGRFASLLVLSILGGYFIFPLLGRALLPAVSIFIAIFALTINLILPFREGDDLTGRILFVGKVFRDTDLLFYLGGRASFALAQLDSGYSYIIGTLSIFGAIALWLFINFYPRCNDAPSRRLNWGIVGYMLGQLLVSSTSLFSIKTSALLWALAGCIRAQPPRQASNEREFS